MNKYISTLHTKSPSHKKRFALLTSAGVTLLIFTVWSLVKFSPESVVVRETSGPVNLALASTANVSFSPFDNLVSGFKSVWQSLQDINGN